MELSATDCSIPFAQVSRSCHAFECDALKDKSGVGMINPAKKVYHVLAQVLSVVSHFELSNGCQFQECSDHLGHIRCLCRHFLASAYDKEARND